MRTWLIVGGVVLLMIVGFVFFQGPSPPIIVAPEVVFHWGGLNVTNTMFTSWIVVGLLVLIAVIAGPRMSVVPSGFSGVVEAALSAFFDMAENVVGERNARKFFPLVATIFFFILLSNYIGLLPMNNIVGRPEPGVGDKQAVLQQASFAGIDFAYIPLNPTEVDTGAGDQILLPEGVEAHGAESGHGEAIERTTDGTFSGIIAPFFRSVMTDVNAPLAIAIFSFVFVEFWGFQALGFGYLKKFFNFGAILRLRPSGLIDVFVGILELMSEFIRMVSFTFRLFGNVFAGEVLLLMMSFLVPFVLVVVFYGLELFVGLIQAFVFAMLTLVFAQMAVTVHGDDHQEEETGAAH